MSEALKAKIAALRAKTTSAGCTEAEALAAAELAARLMREHRLSDEDLAMSEASADGEGVRHGWRTDLCAVIGRCTNCGLLVVVDRAAARSNFQFVGRAPGPEIALYLRDVCLRAVEVEILLFKAGKFYRARRTTKTRRQAVRDFTVGIVARLSERLLALFSDIRSEAARLEADAVFKRRHGSAIVTTSRAEPKTRFDQAMAAGWIAGDGIALNRGVSADADAPPALLR